MATELQTELPNLKVTSISKSAPDLPLRTVSEPKFPTISGYEGVPFDGRAIEIPLPSAKDPAELRPLHIPSLSVPPVDYNGARRALQTYLRQNKQPFRKESPERCTIHHVIPTCGYLVDLETLFEKRFVSWSSEPFDGEITERLLSETTEPPPSPWNIDVSHLLKSGQYLTSSATVEVPDTAFLHPCYECQTKGNLPCSYCESAGKRTCRFCSGKGLLDFCMYCHGESVEPPCLHCNGTGKDKYLVNLCRPCNGKGFDPCHVCDGSGSITCTLCQGKGKNKHFLRLQVDWNCAPLQAWTNQSLIPDDKYKQAKAFVISVDERTKFQPNTIECKNPQIVELANQHIQVHYKSEANGRIVRQRLSVSMIPLYSVPCTISDRSFSFFIYGADQVVYEKEYPLRITP